MQRRRNPSGARARNSTAVGCGCIVRLVATAVAGSGISCEQHQLVLYRSLALRTALLIHVAWFVGVDELLVHIMAANQSGLQFYESHGFYVIKLETADQAHRRWGSSRQHVRFPSWVAGDCSLSALPKCEQTRLCVY